MFRDVGDELWLEVLQRLKLTKSFTARRKSVAKSLGTNIS